MSPTQRENPPQPQRRGGVRRVLVTGSRTWTDETTIRDALARVWAASDGRAVLVCGACERGADAIAEQLWTCWGGQVEAHPAHWEQHGRAAGPRRNTEMVTAGADVCLAFIANQSHGASHCARLAEAAGIPTHRHTPPTPTPPTSSEGGAGLDAAAIARRVELATTPTAASTDSTDGRGGAVAAARVPDGVRVRVSRSAGRALAALLDAGYTAHPDPPTDAPTNPPTNPPANAPTDPAAGAPDEASDEASDVAAGALPGGVLLVRGWNLPRLGERAQHLHAVLGGWARSDAAVARAVLGEFRGLVEEHDHPEATAAARVLGAAAGAVVRGCGGAGAADARLTLREALATAQGGQVRATLAGILTVQNLLGALARRHLGVAGRVIEAYLHHRHHHGGTDPRAAAAAALGELATSPEPEPQPPGQHPTPPVVVDPVDSGGVLLCCPDPAEPATSRLVHLTNDPTQIAAAQQAGRPVELDPDAEGWAVIDTGHGYTDRAARAATRRAQWEAQPNPTDAYRWRPDPNPHPNPHPELDSESSSYPALGWLGPPSAPPPATWANEPGGAGVGGGLPIEAGLAYRLADEAIGLFLAYRDLHGHRDELSARAEAAWALAENASIAPPTPPPADSAAGGENAGRWVARLPRVELLRLLRGYAGECHEVEQILAAAFPEVFPLGDGEHLPADERCVGDATPAALAAHAAAELTRLRGRLADPSQTTADTTAPADTTTTGGGADTDTAAIPAAGAEARYQPTVDLGAEWGLQAALGAARNSGDGSVGLDLVDALAEAAHCALGELANRYGEIAELCLQQDIADTAPWVAGLTDTTPPTPTAPPTSAQPQQPRQAQRDEHQPDQPAHPTAGEVVNLADPPTGRAGSTGREQASGFGFTLPDTSSGGGAADPPATSPGSADQSPAPASAPWAGGEQRYQEALRRAQAALSSLDHQATTRDGEQLRSGPLTHQPDRTTTTTSRAAAGGWDEQLGANL